MTTVGESASDRIDRDLASLTASAIDAQAERWPGLYDAFTIKQLERAVEDTRFHLQFLSAALWSGEQVVMDDHYCWTRDLFANIGLKQEWLDGALDDIRAVLVGALPTDEGREAARMIDHAMAGDHCSAVPAIPLIDQEPPNAGAVAYLAAAIASDRLQAARLLQDEIDGGVTLGELYLQVIQPAQHEIGRLWHAGRLTVAQEHLASAITERAMAQVILQAGIIPAKDLTVLVACVGSEEHAIGALMVSDLFAADGWNVRYTGPRTPIEAIVKEATRQRTDLVALSATMVYRIRDVARVITMLKDDPRTRDVPVLVGGRVFGLAPSLVARAGADAWAFDAAEAVIVGNQLVEGMPRRDTLAVD